MYFLPCPFPTHIFPSSRAAKKERGYWFISFLGKILLLTGVAIYDVFGRIFLRCMWDVEVDRDRSAIDDGDDLAERVLWSGSVSESCW